MSMKSVFDSFEKDHDRLDAHFGEFQRLKRTDFPAAKADFKAFMFGLRRHIVWEEEILFPVFEKATGMRDAGPTAVMRHEHVLIKLRLDALHEKVRAADPDCDAEAQALLAVLKDHNMKEEQILYPAIDRMLAPGELAAVESAMAAIPEQQGCGCGHANAHG
ncbi:MAG: hypothetical protein FD126_2661 [Elusimicrobia bacterium]|nr:MAG: hypothetical protein FD126_2661 [Elusimicrobiota bacterium]